MNQLLKKWTEVLKIGPLDPTLAITPNHSRPGSLPNLRIYLKRAKYLYPGINITDQGHLKSLGSYIVSDSGKAVLMKYQVNE